MANLILNLNIMHKPVIIRAWLMRVLRVGVFNGI